MEAQYIPVGQVLPGLDAQLLEHEESRRLLAACQRSSAFEVIELRRMERRDDGATGKKIVDVIVVDCCDGTVPSHNPVGIKNRERLILVFGLNKDLPHEVRALRRDFPDTLHQNQVMPGDAHSLCLYFEPWSSVERTWTPANHLQRILWWLRETALGTLHRSDQPLERMYLQTSHQIVLPADFLDRAANPLEVLQLGWARSKPSGMTIRGHFLPRGTSKENQDGPAMDSLVVLARPAVASRIERYPTTLGQLHDQMAARGSDFVSVLTDTLKKLVPEEVGLPIRQLQVKHTLLLLQIPMAAVAVEAPSRTDVIGFLIEGSNLAALAIACEAAFDGKDGKAYANRGPIPGTTGTGAIGNGHWRALAIEPVDVRIAFQSKDVRRASGIPEEGAEFDGVLAGVGALGSCMAELWSRAGWGNWTYIDHDNLLPHNLVRHIGKDWQIGWEKVDALAQLAELTWPTGRKPVAISAKATDLENAEVARAIAGSKLLVDASTTLEVPRDLSDGGDGPRMVSTFITPSGRDSVLLLEDSARAIRMYAIEAQYYRAVLNDDWGATHLNGHHGTYWVGGGCRDLSGVLSHELVQLHGSTLARQVRLLSAQPDAQIRIWVLDEVTGALTCKSVLLAKPREMHLREWRIIWDEGLEAKLGHLREASLPVETGGVILGYVDQKRKAIHVVDVLPAPTDSAESPAEFVRGATGLREAIESAASKTANIVGYIGEWHSHPRHSSATPSTTDAKLLAHLATTLAMDGLPGLMVIVGEGDISISLGEGCLQ